MIDIEKIDIEKIDEKYLVFVTTKDNYRICRKEEAILEGEETISEAFYAQKNASEVTKFFSVSRYGFAPLEDFIVARKLNDELKVISGDFYTLVFGNLEHFVTRQPISYPPEFKRLDKYTEHEIDVANQVLFLSPEKDADRERVMYVRKMLKNLLLHGQSTTVEDLLGESEED